MQSSSGEKHTATAAPVPRYETGDTKWQRTNEEIGVTNPVERKGPGVTPRPLPGVLPPLESRSRNSLSLSQRFLSPWWQHRPEQHEPQERSAEQRQARGLGDRINTAGWRRVVRAEVVPSRLPIVAGISITTGRSVAAAVIGEISPHRKARNTGRSPGSASRRSRSDQEPEVRIHLPPAHTQNPSAETAM